jgi:hypothetical protein
MVIRLTLLFRVVAVGRLILKLIGESWLEIPVRMAEPQSLNIRTDINFPGTRPESVVPSSRKYSAG